MIQDIAPHTLNNRYEASAPLPDSVVLFAKGDSFLFPEGTGSVNDSSGEQGDILFQERHLSLPYVGSLPEELLTHCGGAVFLFRLDERAYFLVRDAFDKEQDAPEGYVFVSPVILRKQGKAARPLMFALLTALHVSRWYGENRYCGSCGTLTQIAKDERALDCPACKRRIYPKIMPAVIVGVCNGDEIVLTRYANRPMAYHALVAGFNEIGETLEDTVRREVMEEVGLHVTNIRYYKSQPWAVAGDILSGFFCDVQGDPAIRVDEAELQEAVWVRREDVDAQPDDFSLTNEMMMVFKAGKEPK